VTDLGGGQDTGEDDGHGPYSPSSGSGCHAESGTGGQGGTGAYFNTLNAIQRQQAVSAITNLSQPCQQAITADNINLQQMAVNAASTNFYSTDVFGSLSVQSVSGYLDPDNPNETLSQYVGNGIAAALYGSNNTITNSIVLNSASYFYFTSGSYGTSLAESQNIVLVHEEMHIATTLDDIGLAARLGLGNFGQVPGMTPGQAETAASMSISSWLEDGCAPVGGHD
jgi:hypothetical protein